MTTLESTKKGMFRNENTTFKNKQIEAGHDKKSRVDAKDKFKKNCKKKTKKKLKKKRKKKKKRILNYIMSLGIFGQTSCEKNVIKIIESPR